MSEEVTPQPDSEVTPKPIAFEIVEAEGHKFIYANNATVLMNFFDFRLAFGDILEATEEKMKVSSRATIVLTPELAKRVLMLLERNLSRYEEQFGKIRELPE